MTLGATGACALAYALPAYVHRLDDAWDYDEGPLLQAAALAREGHRLYAEVSLNKPPVLMWLLDLGFSLGGVSLSVARITVLAVTLVGFLSFGALAARLFGMRAALPALVLLWSAEAMVSRAAVVMPDLPSMSFMALALLGAEGFARTSRHTFWALSAVAYTLAVGTHPLVAAGALPLAALLVSGEATSVRAKLRVLVGYATLVLALAALGLLSYDRAGMLRWMVRYNLAIRRTGTELTEGATVLIGRYLRAHGALVAAALASAVVLGRARETRRGAVVMSLWFASTALTFSLWKPLWDNYFLWMLVPLAVLAGGGCGRLLALAWEGAQPRWMRAMVGVGALSALLAMGVHTAQSTVWRGRGAETEAVVRDLQRVSAPGEYVASDDPFVVFVAGRRAPPPMADTSHKSIVTGYLRSEEALATVRRYGVRVILLGTGRLERMEPFVRAVRLAAIDVRRIGEHERLVIDPRRLP